MADPEKYPLLTMEEFLSPQGCGAGTDSACYALTQGEAGIECMMVSQNPALDMAGIRLGWRMNIDGDDGRPWCPKGVIPNSKTADLGEQPATQ